jgi:LacI family transcriptional regulator
MPGFKDAAEIMGLHGRSQLKLRSDGMTRKSTHPTLSEVAKRAGVGTTTASRVINGGHRVSAETLARVRGVIKSLGYIPNPAARALKGYQSRMIGLIVPSIADSFFSSCAEAAQAVARANDSLLIVTTTQNSAQSELENMEVLMRHRADGLIIAPADSQNQALRDMINRIDIPVVAIDRPVADAPVISVITDNFKAARNAVRHLIDHGYKRIVCLTGEPNLYTIGERIRGYRKAVESAGLPCLVDTSVEDFDSAGRSIARLLGRAKPPDAFFTLKNRTTINAFETLQRLQVSIPERVALLGFDDFELASAVRPSISVVQQPVEEIGRVAAELLFEKLLSRRKGNSPSRAWRPRKITLETRLIQRSSCGCKPANS